MPKFKTFTHQFHWKPLFIRIVVNAAALTLTAIIIPDIYFVDRSFWSILILSIGLGVLNAIVKPVILLLTGQFIFVTFGLLVILVNTLLLYLLERVFPNAFAVTNFWWALVGGLVFGLASNALENLLGLTPPIVPQENLDLRKQIEARQARPLVTLVTKPQTVVQHDIDTQSLSDFTAPKESDHAKAAASAGPAEEGHPAAEMTGPAPDANPIPDDDGATDPNGRGAE